MQITEGQARQQLQTVFGYSEFRGQQEAIISSTLAGEDTLVIMPTGGGKSLCYQLPSMLLEGVGIIVSPLIALMQDQVSALRQLGISTAFLNSTQDARTRHSVQQQLQGGELELLYIAPERLLQPQTLQWLSQLPVALIAIDEAHCVSQWGHDFRQDYLALHQLRDYFPRVPRMALTATADQRTREEIVERLALNRPAQYISGFDRPNIRYSVRAKTDARKQLLSFLAPHRDESGIVYCLSRKKVESTAEWLCTRGLTALPYHAGLPAEQRASHQQRFLREDGVIIVATIAFGMGIDKPDVRFVAHLDLPKSIEAYYQETGRAGRDGEPADAWMVYGLQDVVRLSQMVAQSGAPDSQKRIERHKLEALLGWCEVTQCRRRALLEYFGDTLAEDCGNCDVCLNPPKTWDATIAAQKLLSCVYRTGQRFGAAHVIDVLRGKETDKTGQHRHQALSTWGIGDDRTEQQWRSVIRQLIVQQFLQVDMTRFGALTLTGKSRPLLRNELTLRLREDPSEMPLRKPASEKRERGQGDLTEHDRQLWDALRQCRKRLAEQHNVPPYVIFHDATLMEMMQYHPTSHGQLLDLNGVGQTKLEKYGDEFLAVINSALTKED